MTVAKKAVAKPKKAAAKTAIVYGKAAQGQKRGRVLFEGTQDDADVFIANNFPREHSEEAGPDFTVESSTAADDAGDDE